MIKLPEEIVSMFKKYSQGEVLKGMEVEREHNDITQGNIEKRARIVLAHLKENPKYYSILDKMEAKHAMESSKKKR